MKSSKASSLGHFSERLGSVCFFVSTRHIPSRHSTIRYDTTRYATVPYASVRAFKFLPLGFRNLRLTAADPFCAYMQ